jgi:hypothetical protein
MPPSRLSPDPAWGTHMFLTDLDQIKRLIPIQL